VSRKVETFILSHVSFATFLTIRKVEKNIKEGFLCQNDLWTLRYGKVPGFLIYPRSIKTYGNTWNGIAIAQASGLSIFRSSSERSVMLK
jgi:hypothetical protein